MTAIDPAFLGEQLVKLSKEVERLQRDVQTLDQKIEPFDKRHKYAKEYDQGETGRIDWRDGDAFSHLKEIRNAIHGCEAHIAKIRAQLDDMAEHAASRDAIKPYLKKKK
jgi:phage shock protein A